MAAAPDRAELRELYKIALEEYRYEVSLSWDRLKHYFLVNAGLTTAGATLLKGFGSSATTAADLVVAAVFYVALFSAALGIMAVLRSREYYRMTVYKKALLEHLLGYDDQLDGFADSIATLAIGTTRGMRAAGVLRWTERDIQSGGLKIGSLVWYSTVVLTLTGIVDGMCSAFLLYRHLFHALLKVIVWLGMLAH